MKTPTLEEMRSGPHWHALEPIYRDGASDHERGHYCNDYPNGTLRWHAYELGFQSYQDPTTAPSA